MLELELNRITMQYKNKKAVDEVTYTFHNGVYGLLGANGAGKTTLMRMICNILYPTSGEVLCGGVPVAKLGGNYRRLLGYLPQDFGFYPDFTARRYMMYLAELKAVPGTQAAARVEELLTLTGLSDAAGQKIRTFSGGMVRRLGIAQAMLNDPDILILDEPTSGLDPRERIRFRNIISSFARNRIVILSTHIVSDVEYIADEILLLKSGRLIEHGTPEAVRDSVSGKVWECTMPQEQADRFMDSFAVSNRKNVEAGRVRLRIVSDERPVEQAVPSEPGLEDVYLYYFSEERK